MELSLCSGHNEAKKLSVGGSKNGEILIFLNLAFSFPDKTRKKKRCKRSEGRESKEDLFPMYLLFILVAAVPLACVARATLQTNLGRQKLLYICRVAPGAESQPLREVFKCKQLMIH